MKMSAVLNRDIFRNSVFSRDGGRCVICSQPAVDAHHIMERRLFPDGGYYLDNGASLCGPHHIEAEKTGLSCEEIRSACNIQRVILPPHLYPDYKYDKWGNIILQNGLRIRGELFNDESVQKILSAGGVLDKFSPYVKYPRTYHLPWSEGLTDDDRVVPSINHFANKDIIVTEKMDGENTTIYRGYIHARSIDAESHWTQSYVRQLQSRVGAEIPDGWRVCGENLYAKHSIAYGDLEEFFLMFSIWDDKNICLSWDETREWAELLGLKMVPELYRGEWDEKIIKSLHKPNRDGRESEGYVVRLSCSFNYSQFRHSVAKYVRKNHVATSHHWRFNKIELNKKLDK